MQAVLIGDLHFDALQKHFPDNHIQLQIAEIEKPLEYAMRNGIKHIIQLGDVGEREKLSYGALCALIELIARYPKLHFYFILGNHDFAENGVHCLQPFVSMVKAGLLKNVTIFETQTQITIDKIPFNFCPYPFTKGKSGHINVGHFSTRGATMDNGRIDNESEPIKRKHHWELGHLHTPHGDFAGTLYQLSVSEKLPKGFRVITAKIKNGKVKVTRDFVQTDPAFKLINLLIESKSDLKQIEKNPLYRYRLVIKSDFEIQENLMAKYPNVYAVVGVKNKQEQQAALEDDSLVIEHDDFDLPSQDELLAKKLKEHNFNKSKTKRAITLLRKAKESL